MELIGPVAPAMNIVADEKYALHILFGKNLFVKYLSSYNFKLGLDAMRIRRLGTTRWIELIRNNER